MSEPISEIIDRLLDMARPGGTAHKRLLKYKDQCARNVMLGPSVLRYIRHLQELASDEIECRHLTQLGKCKAKKIACTHVDNNSECAAYERSRPQRRAR